MSTDEPELSVDEFVDYCRTQSGLLSGSIRTMGEEAEALLAEIDAAIADLGDRLDAESADLDGEPDATGEEAVSEEDVSEEDVSEEDVSEEDVSEADVSEADVEAAQAEVTSAADLEESIEQKQLLVEAKQARMQAFQDLAAGYEALADEIEAEVDDGAEALDRVVTFEAEHDAPTYFQDRQTVLEAAAVADTGADSTD